MKKVLFVATVDSHILHFHLPYLQMFKEYGYEVHVATNSSTPLPYCDVKHKLPLERSPFSLKNIKAIQVLKKIINKENYNILHCHTPMGGVVARLAARKSRKTNGTRVIYTAHGFHFFKGAQIFNWLLYYPIEKILAKITDTIITINQEDYNIAKKKFKVKQVELVNGVGVNGVKFDFDLAPEEKKNERNKLDLKANDYVLLYVAELNENKNQIMLLEAMKDLAKEDATIKLLLAGEGKLHSYYQQKIIDYKLQDNVFLLGYRKDIPKLLKISDLVVATSKREGLPVNLIEAYLSDTPVIATNVRGHRDIIQKENLVELGDIEELKKKIKNYKNGNSKTDCFCLQKEIYLLENIKKQMQRIYFNVSSTKGD